MRVSASIVTYNSDKTELRKCIESMLNDGVEKVYISDNSPKDDLRTFFSEFDRVEYIYNNANLGYGAAHNVALRRSVSEKTEYHLVINPDVYFDRGVVPAIVEYMDNNHDVGQLIPNTIYPNGDLQYVCRLLPTPMDLIFRRFLPGFISKKLDERFLIAGFDRKHELNAPFLLGSFMFFRVSSISQVGLFDESIFMYMEDIDITRRMHKYFKTMFWPEATIVHAHKAESYKNKKMLKVHMKSAIKYFNKWGWLFDRERKIWNREIVEKYRVKH